MFGPNVLQHAISANGIPYFRKAGKVKFGVNDPGTPFMQ